MAQVSCTMYNFPHHHPLRRYNDGPDYVCGGCHLPGDRRNARHGCSTCNFNLHDSCAACPNSISTFMHRHELTLILWKAEGMLLWCDLCGSQVEGMYYGCISCEFYLHPICTKLPERVPHTLHREHPLRLQNVADTPSCLVCREMCSSWHYRCDGSCAIAVGIHIGCIASANQTANIESTSSSRSPWHTYPATAPPGPYYPTYGGGYASPANLPPPQPQYGAYHNHPSFHQPGVCPHPQNGAYYPPRYYNFQAVAGGPNPLTQYGGYCPPHYGGAAGGWHPQSHPYPCGVPPQSQMNPYGTHSSEWCQAVPAQGWGRTKIGAMVSSIIGAVTVGVGSNLISELISDLCLG